MRSALAASKMLRQARWELPREHRPASSGYVPLRPPLAAKPATARRAYAG